MAINFTFNETEFSEIFPFYILVNQQMVVESNGKALEKLYADIAGKNFKDYFKVKRPHIDKIDFGALKSLTHQLIVVECANAKQTSLRGQIDYLPATNQLLFLGSPWFGSIEEVAQHNLSLQDFANHDSMTDLLQVMKTQHNNNEELNELLSVINAQKEELKSVNKEAYDIALFSTQDPDPLLRINYHGDLLQNNPAAALLDFIKFENKVYRNDDFFYYIATTINKDAERWEIEVRSNSKDYLFVCVNISEEGYINIYGRDITKQKNDRRELENLSLIIQQTVNAVIITDAKGQIEWVNNAFESTTGFALAEVIGKKPGSFLQGQDTSPATVKYMGKQIEEAKSFTCEIFNYKKTGEGYWLRINGQPIFDQSGRVIKFFAIEEDITKEREALEKIKDFDKRFNLAMQKIGDNVWEHNFLTEETVFSQQEFLLLDYDSDEFSKNVDLWYNSIYNDDKHIVIDNDKQYRSGAIENHSLEYRMITKDGSLKWVLDRGVIIEKTKDGKPLKIIGTHTDITQQKLIEEELKKAKNAAEASTKAKELFLANMSHEIRTPMNAIVGMSGQLSKTPLNTDQKFYLSTIKSAADNLLVIINDILDLSKIEAGKLTMEQIGFEPKSVLDRVMQVMIHKAEERGLSFTNSYCDSRLSSVLIGDPYRLNQILLNLISNSIKFTEKGSVDIRCTMKSENNAEQLVEVQVIDTGIGMDETFSKNLFQKFKQEDDSITRKYGGTGLGMSICKELVELMGGEITVSSKKGEGTAVSFTVAFKKGTTDDLPKKNIDEVDVSSLYGKKILVTDDNEMNRLVASTILNNYGVEIEEASNGKIALQKIQEQQFDIVLMDVQMPEMDGMEATRYIRNNISKDLPIVALTAFAVKGDSEKFINSGMNDYLSKPFDEAQLLSVIIKLLGGTKTNNAPVIPITKIKDVIPDIDLYDLSKLEDIAKGNKTFIDKMVALFVEQVPLAVVEIKEAYEAKNFEKIKKTAHRIKPSIDSMGIALLTNDIREIEKMAEVYQTSEQLEGLIAKLDDIINKVVTKLNK